MPSNIEVVVVDMGNTAIKSSEIRDGRRTNPASWSSIDEILLTYPHQSIAISTVRSKREEFQKLSKNNRILLIGPGTKLPIQLNYETPETLGIDRIALAVGAFSEFPNQDNLIIDMGTCVTMDLIDRKGAFHGGVITPGLTMRMKAMADYTTNLPDITHEWIEIPHQLLGKSTKACLLNGSYMGLLREINGFVETLRNDFTSLNIIISGGDAHFFESRLKAHIFAGSKIAEIGIYRIWKHQ